MLVEKMKKFPIIILLLCITVSLILYVIALRFVEQYYHDKISRDIKRIYLGDTLSLLQGKADLVSQVGANIEDFLADKSFGKLGIEVTVFVRTKDGRVIYPPPFQYEYEGQLRLENESNLAKENYRIMSEGLDVEVKVDLRNDGLLAVFVLLLFIAAAFMVFAPFYVRWTRQSHMEEIEKDRKISQLAEKSRQSAMLLESLRKDREELLHQLEGLKSSVKETERKAAINENEMIDEIIKLEEELERNLQQQQYQQEQIDLLTKKLHEHENRTHGKKKAGKTSNANRRRFKSLYKNVEIREKALKGFSELTDDMQIKAEEVILMLNHDPEKVKIKRKVFGKKNRKTVFEVAFGYKGRLYFSRDKYNMVTIYAIGSKNTQIRDLEYLDKL